MLGCLCCWLVVVGSGDARAASDESASDEATPAETEEGGSWETEDLDGWLSEFEAGDTERSTPRQEPVHAHPASIVGAMRLMGGYLHVPDVAQFYPDGDDGLGAAVGRLIVRQEMTKHLHYRFNVFADLSSAPALLTGGTFQTAGATRSVYRNPFMDLEFWNEGRVAGTIGLDRLLVSGTYDRISFSLGRFALNYSVTNIFTPNDFFAPFSATAINKIYKPGVDAGRLTIGLGSLSSLELAGVVGYGADGAAAAGNSAGMLRLGTVRWNTEWAALAGRVAERWVVGASAQGDLGRVGIRGEGHVGFPDVDGDGLLDDAEDIHVRLAAGPTVNFAWKNTVLGVEYGYWSDGVAEPEDYLARIERFYPDDLRYLARHYVGAFAGLDAIPILRLAALGLVNAQDGSGIAGANAVYSVANEVDFVAGVYVPWGADPRVEGAASATPRLRSEYGLAPLSVFLETRLFF